jgi:hypothetical protein
MNKNVIGYVHAAFTVLLALFFLNAGVKKFIPKPPRPMDTATVIAAIEKDVLPQPVSFQLTIRAMKQSGFLYIIGVFQILAALLMVWPKTRLLGLLLLLPVIVNIFLLHVFMDNRMHENVETGFLLALTVLLTVFYYRRLLPLIR